MKDQEELEEKNKEVSLDEKDREIIKLKKELSKYIMKMQN